MTFNELYKVLRDSPISEKAKEAAKQLHNEKIGGRMVSCISSRPFEKLRSFSVEKACKESEAAMKSRHEYN